ncbi:MAG: two-component system chemotaxis sensor kinase CheA [Marinoscillum sp.]
MSSKESEYKELFLVEAKDSLEQLDKLFVNLEKDHKNQRAISEIFRIMHTLKGNSMGMGFDAISELTHVIEDVMLAIQEGRIELNEDLFKLLFRANDKLIALVRSLETGEKVSFLGIKTSLSLFLEKALETQKIAVQKIEIKESEQEDKDEESTQISLSDVVQIPVKRMDELLNEAGQLIIERDRLIAASQKLGLPTSEFERLKRITSNLQYSIMNMRMVHIGFLFNKFHRVLRDAATIEGKKVNLILKGTETEIDRNILTIIGDSLVHLVRNAVSHGIESGAERVENGKNEQGIVTLDATYERDRVVISVSDDGGGIDAQVIRKRIVEKGLVNESVAEKLSDDEVIGYIFEAGFSNADKVNELSGRGVGMDVVKRAVESIAGQVKIRTKLHQGTTFELHVPASLALKGTLLFEIELQEYAIALSYTEAVMSITKKDIHKLAGGLTTQYKDEPISLVFLRDILKLNSFDELNQRGVFQQAFQSLDDDQMLDVIIVSYGGRLTGIAVDRVIQQKEIIEKPLAKPLLGIKLLSGTTILGSGKVCPVIDIVVLTDLVHKQALNRINN